MRYTNLPAFQKHLESAAPSHLSHVYLVMVGNDYERKWILNSILYASKAVAERFCGKEDTLGSIAEALESPSLFGGVQAVLVDEAEEAIESLFSKVTMHSTYLFLGTSKKSALAAKVEKEGIVLDLLGEKPWDKEKRLKEWIEKRVAKAGKRIDLQAIEFLFGRVDQDLSFLEQEIEKLLAYIGERAQIGFDDIKAVGTVSRTQTLWHMAEEIVWERNALPEHQDANLLYGLISPMRTELHLGLKIATLLQEGISPSREHFPSVWPKVLEKRCGQSARLGVSYFQKGLDALFQLELFSRTMPVSLSVLIDLFRAKLIRYSR